MAKTVCSQSDGFEGRDLLGIFCALARPREPSCKQASIKRALGSGADKSLHPRYNLGIPLRMIIRNCVPQFREPISQMPPCGRVHADKGDSNCKDSLAVWTASCKSIIENFPPGGDWHGPIDAVFTSDQQWPLQGQGKSSLAELDLQFEGITPCGLKVARKRDNVEKKAIPNLKRDWTRSGNESDQIVGTFKGFGGLYFLSAVLPIPQFGLGGAVIHYEDG